MLGHTLLQFELRFVSFPFEFFEKMKDNVSLLPHLHLFLCTCHLQPDNPVIPQPGTLRVTHICIVNVACCSVDAIPLLSLNLDQKFFVSTFYTAVHVVGLILKYDQREIKL